MRAFLRVPFILHFDALVLVKLLKVETCLSKEREERQSLEMCKQGAECLGDSNHYKSIFQRISGTNESQSELFSFLKVCIAPVSVFSFCVS